MEYFRLLHVVVLFSVLYLSRTTLVESEPSCYSDFDYKDKLLTKVIEMEVHIKSELKKYEELNMELQDKLQVFTAKMNSNERTVDELNTAVQYKLIKVDNALANSDLISSEIRNHMNRIEQHVDLSIANITQMMKQGTVAFTAYELKNGDDVPLGEMLIYTQAVTNVGDAYDPTTGIFTTPVKGVYYFVAQFASGGSVDVTLAIKSEGRIIQNGRSSNEAPVSTTSFSGVALLQNGEQVWVECILECGNNRLWISPKSRTSFSGMLIQALP